MRDVVVDADGEVILGEVLLQLVEDAFDHGGREFFGGEAVAAADDAWLARRAACRWHAQRAAVTTS